jgi:hypothetical protein
MPMYMNVREARQGGIDKARMRMAVLGGWYSWEEVERPSVDDVSAATRADEAPEGRNRISDAVMPVSPKPSSLEGRRTAGSA